MSKDNEILDNTYISLHRIIPFANVDGSGNRCSIFLQGCNINCLYCHNPETIPLNSNDAQRVNLTYLLNRIKDSMPFIRGITVSGGEPTLHYQELIPLFKEVKKLGLTCYLDSNGFFNYDKIKDLIDVTDKFLFDIKGLGNFEKLCFDYQNKDGKEDNKQIEKPQIMFRNLENLKKVLALSKVEEVRLVHIKGFYDPFETVRIISETIKEYPEVLFKLIRVHPKGSRDNDYIAKMTPTIQEHNDLAEYFKSISKNKIVIIN